MTFFEELKKGCPDGYFEGKIYNSSKEVVYYVRGSWKVAFYLIKIQSNDEKVLKGLDFKYFQGNAIKININDSKSLKLIEIPSENNISIYEIWKISDEECFLNFNQDDYLLNKYAYNLNYINENLLNYLPISDSRRRPDQRKLEDGFAEEAEIEKKRIDENQREAHKNSSEHYRPYYFDEVFDSFSKENSFCFNGEYWSDREKGDFSRIRNIF